MGQQWLKIDNHKAEFLFVHLMVALFHAKLPHLVIRKRQPGFRAQDVAELLEQLPRWAVPAHQTKRAYISGVLARNEINRDYAYNRRIFRRTRLGVYILNPRMSLRIGDDWIPVYKLLDPQAFFTFDKDTALLSRDLGEYLVAERSERERQKFLQAIADDAVASG